MATRRVITVPSSGRIPPGPLTSRSEWTPDDAASVHAFDEEVDIGATAPRRARPGGGGAGGGTLPSRSRR